jgi:hypothetical protein
VSGRQFVIAVLFAVAVTPRSAGSQTAPPRTTLAPIVRTERAGAGVVRIVYNLNGAAGALFSVALEVSNDGGQSFVVRPSALTGDVGPGVSAGSEKTIEWDSAKDIEDLQIERLVFRVRVSGAQTGSPAPIASAPSPAVLPPDTTSGETTAAVKKSGGLSKGAIAALTGGAAAGGIGIAVAKGKATTTPPSSSTPPPATPPTTAIRVFRGTATGPITFDFPVCLGRGPGSQTEDWTFTLTASIAVASTGSVSGSVNGGVTRVLTGGCPGTTVGATSTFGLSVSQVTGTTSSLSFSGTNAGATRNDQWTFTGSIAADVLSGTLDFTATIPASAPSGAGSGSARFSVNIREQ